MCGTCVPNKMSKPQGSPNRAAMMSAFENGFDVVLFMLVKCKRRSNHLNQDSLIQDIYGKLRSFLKLFLDTFSEIIFY